MIRVLDNDGKEILLAEDNGSMIHSAGPLFKSFGSMFGRMGLLGSFQVGWLGKQGRGQRIFSFLLVGSYLYMN